MAAALFAPRAAGHRDAGSVASTGLREAGVPPPDEVLEVMMRRSIDLSNHRSSTLSGSRVAEAGLIVGMGLRHVQEAVLAEPSAWSRTFRLKELVRRGEYIGPRLPGQDLVSWVHAAHGDRTRDALVHHSPAEDVADPIGGPYAAYETTAVELDDLTARLAALLWPQH